MKRTGEIILIILGMVIYGLFALLGGIMIWMQNNKDEVKKLFEETEDVNDTLSFAEFEKMINEIGSSGWIFTLSLFGAVLIGIVALILLKDNKYPRQATIILAATAVILTLIVGVGAGTGGIFYLIASIVIFFRKEEEPMSL